MKNIKKRKKSKEWRKKRKISPNPFFPHLIFVYFSTFFADLALCFKNFSLIIPFLSWHFFRFTASFHFKRFKILHFIQLAL